MLTEQGLANVIYGLGLSKFSEEEILQILVEEIVQPHRLGKLDEQELANIVYGLGWAEYSDRSHLLILGNEVTEEKRLPAFTDQGLVNIIWGCGRCRFFNERIFSKLIGRAKNRLAGFTPQGVANFVYGLALVQNDVTRAMPETLESLLQDVSRGVGRRGVEDFSLLSLSNLCWSLGELRYYDAEVMLNLVGGFLQQAEKENGEEMTVEFLNMILNACAMLGFHHEEFFSYARGQIFSMLDEVRSVTNALWAMANLGILSLQEFEAFCKRLVMLQKDGQELSFQGAMQVAQASLHISVINGEKYDDCILPIIEQARDFVAQSNQESSFEKDVQRMFTEEGVSFETDRRLVENLLSVDIFIPGNPGLVIECDGPFHYTLNKVKGEFRQLGDTVFRNRLLEASGYKVVCIPYFIAEEDFEKIVRKCLCNFEDE